MFPWSLAVFAVAIRRPRIDWREPNLLLVLLWFGTAFTLCTLSAGKRAHYILPALPAACVIALAVRTLLANKVVARSPDRATGSTEGLPIEDGTPHAARKLATLLRGGGREFSL